MMYSVQITVLLVLNLISNNKKENPKLSFEFFYVIIYRTKLAKITKIATMFKANNKFNKLLYVASNP